MKLNHTLGEMNQDDFERYGEGLYWITIMGQPAKDQPWGWQLDGHHLIINYFVLGDQVVMSPVFLGSEPVVAMSGKYQGTAILQEEQDRGLKFMRSLDAAQRAAALLTGAKPGNSNLTEAFKDNVVLDYAGVRGAELTPPQKADLLALAGLFVANLDEGHAQVKLDEVKAHLDATRFAWIGSMGDDGVFYYRIHSPVVLIEFDHQRPANLRHLVKDPAQPVRSHIHVVVRTPNGTTTARTFCGSICSRIRIRSAWRVPRFSPSPGECPRPSQWIPRAGPLPNITGAPGISRRLPCALLRSGRSRGGFP
jgi:hypothetical protein